MIPESPELAHLNGMSEQQRMVFLTQYNAGRKDVLTGVLLALFLGGFGAHKFYFGETGLGVLYLLFCWTGIPSIIAFIEAFLMRGKVQTYNYDLAARLSTQIRVSVPAF